MKVAILVPIYNDWPSFVKFTSLLNDSLSKTSDEITIIAANDGSPINHNGGFAGKDNISSLEILNLFTNLGHQRAIAVGLCEIYKRDYFDVVVICDGDGEDSPQDVFSLLKISQENPNAIIVAQRTRRSETLPFRFFYHLYKILFKALTGKSIDFGNFCLVPSKKLGNLVFMPELWNHLAACIVKSKLSVIKFPTARGIRYYGNSTMNLASLIIHGLGAISVFIEILLVRILIGMSIVSIASILIGVSTVFIKFATNLAIPGWASLVLGVVSIVFLQSLMLSLMAIFMMLALRASRSIIPAIDSLTYIAMREKIY